MMKSSSPVILFCASLSVSFKLLSGASTTLGRYFLFSTIPMYTGIRTPAETEQGGDSELWFMVFTLSITPIEVELTTPWLEGPAALQMSKTFNKAVFETFVIPTETFSSMKTDFEKFSYKLTGNYNFGVIVFIVPAKFSCDSFTAIPIEGWGKKYIIFTIYAYSTISVTTYQDNKITFNLKACPTVSKSEDQFIEYQGRKLVDGDSFDVVLPALKTFALMLCERVIFGSMTGTEITSEKIIGVVSGNCYAGTLSFGCNGQMSASQEWGTMDIAAEMMMPVESYGKEFIMLYMPRRRRQGFHTVTAAFPDTTIQIGNGGGSETFENIVLKDARSNADLVFTDVRHLKSDKPVLVVYVQESQCTRAGNLREKGDPSLTIIIPMNLFYDIYVWSAPKTDVVKPLGYVIVQVKKADRDFLLFDNQPMPPGTKWVDVIGNDEYTYGDTSIMEGLHNVTGSRFFYFGCYIYGLSDYYSYMNPAGFISSEINMPCTPNRADMQNGDLIDNDCDGSIDEELADGIDNDNDKKVDEDLTRAAPTNGEWGAWREWECTMDCDIKRQERYRSCDNPRPQNGGANCTGSDRESNDKEVCWTGTKCPSNCPPFTWYMDCARSCEHCVTDCNKFKGTCTACKAGFDSPLHSCNQSCPKYKYGLKCRGNCMEKCEGLDCTERVDGTCPDKSNNSWMYWLLLLLLLPFAYLLYYLFKPKQRLVFDEEEFKEDKNKSEPDF